MGVIDGYGIKLLYNSVERGSRSINTFGFNTDQGSQYTSNKIIEVLKDSQIWVSMSGRGRAFDNIMIERLWRTVKYEEVYLTEYDNFFSACEAIEKYFDFYNNKRKHTSLNKSTPSEVYFSGNRFKDGAA